MNRVWKLGAVVVGVAAMVLALVGDAAAAGKGPVRKGDVRAVLEAVEESPMPDAEGQAKKFTWRRGDVVDRQHLKIQFQAPVGEGGLADAAAAAAAEVHALFNHPGEDPHADCVLAFTGLETEVEDVDGTLVEASVAEYKTIVFLRTRRGTAVLQEVKGSCTVGLGTEDEHAGMPEVLEGDEVTITVDGADVAAGAFAKKGKK
jgi:hypothetical protein